MINIGMLTHQDGYNRGASDFYPLIRWKKKFKKEGLKCNFFNSHRDKSLFGQDIVCIDHRYYRDLTVVKNIYPDKNFIIDFIYKLKANNIKVILFDNGDGTGSWQWDMIEHVDRFVKKQLLKNKEKYLNNRGSFSSMPFLEKYDLSERFIEKNLKRREKYTPCPENELYKLRLGWNIGMIDYRTFPLSRFYPIGTARLFNNSYQMPVFENVKKERNIGSSFRGEIKKKSENYSFQRNKVISLFKKDDYPHLKTGGFLSKKKYLAEMKNSKTCVSPYGWGEVCYRDFEAIICGALLIKPDMSHLETFPDIYRKNETYIPLKWDMSDLESTLYKVLGNYERFIPLAEKAQQIYKEVIIDSDRFISHFKNIIN